MNRLYVLCIVALLSTTYTHAQDNNVIGVDEIKTSQEENDFTCYQWNRPRNWGARQAVDTSLMCVAYNYTFPVKKGDGIDFLSDMHILQIGRKVNRCYSAYCERIDSLAFSFLSALDKQKLEMIEFEWTPSRLHKILYDWIPQDVCPLYQDVYTYFDTGKRKCVTRFQYEDYQYVESSEPMSWTYLSGVDTILGVPCNKATTEFRGRKWIAWYTFDIPFYSGPWKFSGLPGLVLKVKDQDSLFCWEAVGFSSLPVSIEEYIPEQNTDKRVLVWLPDYRVRTCTRVEIDHLWKRFWNAPLSIQVLDKMEAIFVDGNDKVITVRISDPIPDGFYPKLEIDK